MSYHHDLDVSWKSLNLSKSSVPEPSPVQVDIIAQGVETVPGPLIGFGDSVSGLVEHQLPFSSPSVLGPPNANSTKDSLASVLGEESTVDSLHASAIQATVPFGLQAS